MNARFFHVALFSGVVLSLGLMVGCSQQEQADVEQEAAHLDDGHAHDGDSHQHGDDVDPHDVPITEEQKQLLRDETASFADAVAMVKNLRDTVQRETQDGIPDNPFDAHQALDKADIIVQWLPKIAQESGVAKEHWETVTTAATELREAFDTVHLNIDNKVDPDFASVAQQMDARLAELKAIAQ